MVLHPFPTQMYLNAYDMSDIFVTPCVCDFLLASMKSIYVRVTRLLHFRQKRELITYTLLQDTIVVFKNESKHQHQVELACWREIK
jgi:hypothetical protein